MPLKSDADVTCGQKGVIGWYCFYINIVTAKNSLKYCDIPEEHHSSLLISQKRYTDIHCWQPLVVNHVTSLAFTH